MVWEKSEDSKSIKFIYIFENVLGLLRIGIWSLPFGAPYVCTLLTYFPSQSKNCCLHVNHWERRGKNSLRPHATLCFQTFDFINVCVQHTCTLWCVGWVALQSYISQSTINTWKRLLIKYIWEDKNGLVSSRLASIM